MFMSYSLYFRNNHELPSNLKKSFVITDIQATKNYNNQAMQDILSINSLTIIFFQTYIIIDSVFSILLH